MGKGKRAEGFGGRGMTVQFLFVKDSMAVVQGGAE